ncbi:ADP-ribosylglycohydrolase family protein [Streptomyces cirratus]
MDTSTATPTALPDTAAPTGTRTLAGTSTSTAFWGRAEQQDFRSRVRGTLLGSAIGDALGAPVAGLSLDGIRETHGLAGLTEPAPAYGRRGSVTASTQLALFTVDGLIRAHVRRDTGGWHADRRPPGLPALGRDPARLGPRRAPPGQRLARAAGVALRPPRPGPRLHDRLRRRHPRHPGPAEEPHRRDAAATARSAPFGLLVGWEPALVLQLAVECATQSHGHPTAFLSAGAFAVTVTA